MAVFLLALSTALLGVATSAPSATAAPACDRVAAPTGSDGAAGTAAAPFRTAQRLIDSLSPGQTGCLMAGRYGADKRIRIRTPRIRIMSYPGQRRATVRGLMRIQPTADHAVVRRLKLDGRSSASKPSPLIYADGVVVQANHISNGRTRSCVHVARYYDSPAPRGVVIARNRIHDCGTRPATNHHHGIYLAAARDVVIRGNWIYDNADRGIQLYPDADGTRIVGNVIDGNGQGIIFGSGDGESPDQNVVRGNLITNSRLRYNVESHSQGAPYGQGNVVRRNCIHGGARANSGGGIQSPQKGFRARKNVIADPLYANRAAKNFSLRGNSPCGSLFGG